MENLNPQGQFKPKWFRNLLNNKGFIRFGNLLRNEDGADGNGDDGDDGDDGDQGGDQGGAGKATTAFYDNYPEDIKSNPTIQKFKAPEDLAKSYLELQSVMGNNKVPIPKDENDKVAIATFNKALGIPDTAEGYELEEVKDSDSFKGLSFGDDEFKAVAHKHGLSTKQANGLKASYIEMLTGIRQNNEQEYTDNLHKTKNELMREWGMKFDQNVNLAQSVMNKFSGSKEEFDHINALIGGDAKALKLLAKVGSQFKEGSLGDLGTPAAGFTKTPNEARTEYEAIMGNPSDVYWSGTNKDAPKVGEVVRKARIDHVESLLKQMNHGQS